MRNVQKMVDMIFKCIPMHAVISFSGSSGISGSHSPLRKEREGVAMATGTLCASVALKLSR